MSDVYVDGFVQHGDVQPSKPISFGSRRGLTAVRNTHSVHERDGTEGTGHANTERQVRASIRRSIECCFVVILLFFAALLFIDGKTELTLVAVFVRVRVLCVVCVCGCCYDLSPPAFSRW